MNPKITLEVGRVHLMRGSDFSRAEMPKELIWNSRTQEENGKQKTLTVIKLSCHVGVESREKLHSFITSFPEFQIITAPSPFIPFTNLVYKITLFP